MSRSILKSSNGNRLIPIAANEGVDELAYESLNKVKPWSSVDDEPIQMNDVHREMQRIHDDLDQMRARVMTSMPPPPKPPFDPIMPPLLPPLGFPDPLGAGTLRAARRSASPMRQMALRDSSSPYGSLDRRQVAIHGQRPLGFGARDVIIPPPPPPPPPPMSLPVPVTPTITEDESGNRIVELVLDLKGFMPEDIHIHTEGAVLHVHARRLSAKRDVIGHGTVEDARVAKEDRRQYALPDVVRAENLRCFVNRNGQLTIQGPLGSEVVPRTNRKKVKFVSGRD